MVNRLTDAISPYLRSHAANPVDWWQWGPEPFAEAKRRDVPVLVSIGYSTCHWCHVMARESFSDPELAAYLNERFVTIKVDREEHPDVDSSYLAAASAFTENLGWPLNVFVTPDGAAFFAGTYWPPKPSGGHPSFRQVLQGLDVAWMTRREQVEGNSRAIVEALTSRAQAEVTGVQPDAPEIDFSSVVQFIAAQEDAEFGGFGGAPKFPIAPVVRFLLTADEPGRALAQRTLEAMAGSELRDLVEGGFFRYATGRDWSVPHYERMLYDNALLLEAYAEAWRQDGQGWAAEAAAGIARFLLEIVQLPSGGFASAQDSESMVDGQLTEGDYYQLSAEERQKQIPPRLDEKVLAGWNGMAISALARAGFVMDEPSWVGAAGRAADYLLSKHFTADGGLIRVSLDGRTSAATATLEDYGMLGQGLLDLSLVTGEVRFAVAGRSLVDATISAGGPADALPFTVPGGGDPVLNSHGTALPADVSEGAYPSGLSACAGAAHTLHQLTGEASYLDAAESALSIAAEQAVTHPLGFGAVLRGLTELAEPTSQLVLVTTDSNKGPNEMVDAARRHPAGLIASVTEGQATALTDEGFTLFGSRPTVHGLPTAYLCRDRVCRLPATKASDVL